MGVALMHDRVWVSGGASDAVVVFELDGTFVESLSTNPPISGPQGIAFDAEGRFYTSSFYTGKVARFSSDGSESILFDEEPGIRVARSIALRPLSGDPSTFVRGDFRPDGRVDISDAVAVLGHLFLGRTVDDCLDAGDADDDGVLNVTDAIYTLSHLFLGGPAPPPPYPEPGSDPTDDELGCR